MSIISDLVREKRELEAKISEELDAYEKKYDGVKIESIDIYLTNNSASGKGWRRCAQIKMKVE